MPIVQISMLVGVSAYDVVYGLSVATRHPAILARPESFERAGLMPRPTLRGRINELVSLAQAEVPRVSEAARNPLRRRQPSAPWKMRCAWSGDSTASAGVEKVMDLQWMARVGLARPSASLRSFAVSLRDLCGEGN